MDRQAQKTIMYGLHYGMNGKSSFMQAYIEELAASAASMAMAKSTGIGYISLESPDFSNLELRCMSHHDEVQWDIAPGLYPERQFTGNQRGRHWDRKRREGVKVKKDPHEVMAFALHDQMMRERVGEFHNPVHKMGEITKAPHRKTIPCQVVEAGGMITLQNKSWWGISPKFWS